MSTVILDAATRDKLLAAGGVVEFRDEAGNLIGRFARADGPLPPAGYVIEGGLLSDEEMDRMRHEGKWHLAADVEERLRQLKKERQ